MQELITKYRAEADELEDERKTLINDMYHVESEFERENMKTRRVEIRTRISTLRQVINDLNMLHAESLVSKKE